jgi:hypothetical protein
MNFPNSIARHVLSTIALIFRRMANVPKCFSNKRDNRHFVHREFSRGPDMQGKSSPHPIENSSAYPILSRFAWHIIDNSPWFVAGLIRQRDVKVAICLDFHGNDAAP